MISHSAMLRSEEERAMRVAGPIVLTPEESTTLEHWARGRPPPGRLVPRAQVVVRAAAGRRNDEIAREVDTDRECVGRWRTRFAAQRLGGGGGGGARGRG